MLVLRGDGPCAVGIIGVAIREPWALHCPIGTLQLECAVLAWRRKRKQFRVARRTPRSFQEVEVLYPREPSVTFPSAPCGLPWAWQPGKEDGEQPVGEGWYIVFSDTEASEQLNKRKTNGIV